MIMEYEFSVEEIKGRIFKDTEGISNYTHVSIEEMDWIVEQATQAEIMKKRLQELTQSFLVGKLEE